MRKSQFFLLAFAAISLLSCDLNNSETNYTPQIFCGTILLNHTDTLLYSYNTPSSKYLLDTVMVGDTVTFELGFYSYANNLEQVAVTCDNEYASITLRLDSIVTSVLTSESNVAEGLLYFPVGYNYVSFNMDYVTKAVSKTTELTLQVASDSKYSPTSIAIITPIVAAE